MERRVFLESLGLTALGSLPVMAFAKKYSGPTPRPNVLFIAIDDLNDWIGCMGGHPNTLTPNIDALAKQGTQFTNAQCQAPLCGPSRASLMTGLRPSTTGIYGQIKDNDIREANDATRKSTYLFEYFHRYGYKTMAVGKLFHQHVPSGTVDESGGREKGFGPKPPHRLNWNRKGTSTDWGPFPDRDEQMPDYRSAQWAIERLYEKHNKPFLLAAGFLRPHVPWHVPKKWFDLHPIDNIQTPPFVPSDYDDLPEIAIRVASVPMMPTTEWAIKNKKWKEIVQAYLACVSFVDDKVGKVMKVLKASSYSDNTIIVLWSDHGYHLGEKNRFAKHSLWERATRAPLIIAGPHLNKGQTCSKPVGMIDLYPTLLDLCGLPANPQNQGHSLLPLMEDPEHDWPHAAVTTYGRNNHAIRTEFYRYIHYENGAEELYDHRIDNNEWTNLANRTEYRELKARLKKFLPQINVPWAPVSRYDINDYFREQREREKK